MQHTVYFEYTNTNLILFYLSFVFAGLHKNKSQGLNEMDQFSVLSIYDTSRD